MNITATPASERLIGLMIRADGCATSDFGLAADRGGHSGLAADIHVSRQRAAGQAVAGTSGIRSLLPAQGRIQPGGMAIDVIGKIQ